MGLGCLLFYVDWDFWKIMKFYEVDKGIKNWFNDGKCDLRGRVWVGKYLILYLVLR